MQKTRFLILLLGWLILGPLHAQESEDEDEPDYIESDWDGYMPSLYSRGDQTFTISLGVIFPALFYNEGVYVKNHNFTPPVGGMGVLGYTYFINSNYFLGGEIGLKFNYTLGQNTIFMIPIGLRTGWQFIISRFEIPLHVTAGIAPQRYLNNSYVGLFVKGGGSLYFRFSPDWSFGLNADWSWYPQWPRENGKPIPQKNMDGHIVGLTLSARYHF